MSLSISDALHILDQADPANDWPLASTDAAWTELVATRDDFIVVDFEPGARRRSTRVWVVAACVLAVVCAAVALAVRRGGSSGEQPSHAPSSYATSPAEAKALANKFLAKLGAPSGAAPFTGGKPHVKIGAYRSVSVVKAISVPGGVDDAIRFYKHHLPKGYGTDNREDSPNDRAFLFSPSGSKEDVLGVIEATTDGSRTAVYLQIVVPWFSTRTSAEYIDTPNSVIATVTPYPLSLPSSKGRAVHRTLTRTEASAIIDALNAAPIVTPDTSLTCDVPSGHYQIELQIDVGATAYDVVQHLPGCGVSISRSKADQPALAVNIAPLVFADLGLPTH